MKKIIINLSILALIYVFTGCAANLQTANAGKVVISSSDMFYFAPMTADPLNVASKIENHLINSGFKVTNYENQARFGIVINYTYSYDLVHYIFQTFSLKIIDIRTGNTIFNISSGMSWFEGTDSVVNRASNKIAEKFRIGSSSQMANQSKSNFEIYDTDMKIIKNMLQNLASDLNPIEGIWENYQKTYVDGVLFGDNYSGTCAIIRDTLSNDRDFIEVTLSSNNYPTNAITAHFFNTSYDFVYTSNQYSPNGNYQRYKYIIDDVGLLKSTSSRIESGKQVSTELYYIKIFPEFNESKSIIKVKEQLSTGSGFIIAKSGLTITNYHVVKDKSDIEIFLPSINKTIKANLVLKDKNNDIAVLSMDNFKYDTIYNNEIPFIIKRSEKVNLGQKVFTLGFPLGELLGKNAKLSTGSINSLYGIQDDPRLYQMSNPIQPGNSGGPLFNYNGELIGIVVASLNAKYFYENESIIPQNVNFAIKSNYLLNLISMLPEDEELSKRRNFLKGKSLEEQIELITPFVVAIKAK